LHESSKYFYPSAVFEKYQYDLNYKVSADYVLNMQVWGDDQFKRKFFPLTIVSYDMNGISSQNKDQVFRREKPTRKKVPGLVDLFALPGQKTQRKQAWNYEI
jgi:hypothetical protein